MKAYQPLNIFKGEFMEKTSVSVEFAIVGESFSIKDVTNRLRIFPTDSYSKDDLNNGTKYIRKETCWSIATKYENSLDIIEQLNKIIYQLIDKVDLLKDIKKEYNVSYRFFVAIQIFEEQTPAIYLDSDTIEFASKIGADFDFDMYIIKD